MTTHITATVHATEYPPHLKHRVIFETFDRLNPNEAMLLVNDHDPKPLHYQFNSTRNGQFEWEYLEQGPEVFQIKITRIKEQALR
ncbi:hypothetical protein GCM10011391_23380 [Pullulanibacillus camelliae]|uniref:DUF2249 domain-containing protein n=1 Tax=Pullulanibacillus camelliae TaxID=1707096 RepID=A0A8J3DUR8_9BACL|nr:DUF2249 domain-containing protein [Pullulanibacillus camelliae]GGE43879.1 hypothetical protein GCM10011391_23380 [Pullulanibacillus camelliae]